MVSTLILRLFNAIFYFPSGKSTIWGIYSEYFLFFGDPLSKSKFKSPEIIICHISHWNDIPWWYHTNVTSYIGI